VFTLLYRTRTARHIVRYGLDHNRRDEDAFRSPAMQDQDDATVTLERPAALAGLTALSAAVAACGGSGGSEPSPPPPPPAAVFTTAEASRLLAQASFGADRAEVDRARGLGAAGWIDDQLALPRSQSHVDWLTAQGFNLYPDFQFSRSATDYTVWRKFLSSPDQLRQRVVFALSQILVIGVDGISSRWPAFQAAYYLDLLEQHAFGNFRALLEAVTLSPAMGNYLSMRGSRRADTSGRQPDENYAREVMQLFSIGLVDLNPDGTPRGGTPTDSYVQADVTGLARVFTGWDYAAGDTTTPATVITPMVNTASRHESGAKTFLGITIPAATSAADSLRIALDTLAGNANVGPFIGRQLIQRLVTSNPSAAYVGRVSAVWANDGSGVRGNLAAVVRAILLDVEARDTAAVRASASAGKLREPVLRFAQWARAARAGSASGQWRLPNLSDPATRLGQSPLRSASVFNFYRPGYVPPNTSLATAGRVAPELQITTETSVAGYLNFMQSAIATVNGVTGSDVRPDYSTWLALAADPQALADEANLVLASGQLSTASVTLIRDAVAAIAATNTSQRVQVAMLLTLGAPEYLVLK
jgi:uncharacterized protein (DUF1800 family)